MTRRYHSCLSLYTFADVTQDTQEIGAICSSCLLAETLKATVIPQLWL